eukprot:7378581-Prymnesium_polylepis.1
MACRALVRWPWRPGTWLTYRAGHPQRSSTAPPACPPAYPHLHSPHGPPGFGTMRPAAFSGSFAAKTAAASRPWQMHCNNTLETTAAT